MKHIFQPFHLVTLSPWPLVTSVNLLSLMMSMGMMFNYKSKTTLYLSLILLIICSYQWWRDIVRESTFQGYHTVHVIETLKLGMIMFITSEVFFFIAFFWSYFHMFLSPSIQIGNFWPPMGMKFMLINPYQLPLMNTIILISSGMFLTMSHYALINKNLNMTKKMMMLTIIFGMIFTIIQIYEYFEAPFSMFMSNYGTTFFMMTGFHGLHVMVGTIFIIIEYKRMSSMQFSNLHHIGFEASAWYWHFVDVVWLFLFLFIYWWPF
uniref:Cytochrome c oxidase subunit 3 n=1 Tax=Ceratobaeus sp. MM-2013 TaxID=1429432 RepID=A0A067YF92_9HYME|nr:cytochrome c oxidase subunit III [Ceratobaeus sp. MM-2013]